MPAAIFSAAPLEGIDIEALPPSRFLLQRERRFPYRDLKGRVNFHLVAAALEEVEAGKVGEAALADTIRAWHRHADRALADERLTLSELLHASKRKRAAASPAAAAAAPAGSRLRTVAERGLVTPTRRCGRQPRDATPPTRPRPVRNFLRHAPDSDDSKEDPVYEVHSLLDERAEGGEPHFLVRWSGFGSEDDTWEPEAGLSPALVSAFRFDKARGERFAGEDYRTEGRALQLWCSRCRSHRNKDDFSVAMRRAPPARRSCLLHPVSRRSRRT